MNKYEEEILELIDNRDEFTRSDLQGVVSALVKKMTGESSTHYIVKVKQVHTYDNVPANSKQEAIDSVRNHDWHNHDEQDSALEFTALQK